MNENNKLTYYQRNRKKILNKAKDKYKNLSEEGKIKRKEYAKNGYHNMSEKDKYKNLSEEDKNKRREYGKNRYHNMFEEKSKNIKSIRKNIRKQTSLK